MSEITARLATRFGDFTLEAAFTIPGRGVTGLFGPSGCGKTTVLRCLAGLARAERGYLAVNGAVWQDDRAFVPAHRRPVGYVFQEASLFAHLSVRGNLLFGHRRAPTPTDGLTFGEVVELLGLGRLLDRSPALLSGGERQRVAIGRALLSRPRVLLMDEPLSALDRFSKDEIIPYLEALQRALALPVVYVTHDIVELERLADWVVLMADGRVSAAGPLTDLAGRLDLPLARRAGAGSVFEGVVVALDTAYHLTTLRIAGGVFTLPGEAGPIGAGRRLRVDATDVSLARTRPTATTILNILPAVVRAAEPLGPSQMLVALALGEHGEGARLLARITRRSWDALALQADAKIFAQVKSVSLVDA